MKDISIQKTEDLSPTLFSSKYNEHYHSKFGAVNESLHVFISGLKQINKKEISIFEMGFGTGLNALLTLEYAELNMLDINYYTIEKHPIEQDVFNKLIYSHASKNNFTKLHSSKWEEAVQISKQFSIHKSESDLKEYIHQNKYDLVYFDAFSPDIQPDLWTSKIFDKIYKQMNKDGIFLTYSVKGVVKRALKSVGFKIEKVPGPKGKREILRAYV